MAFFCCPILGGVGVGYLCSFIIGLLYMQVQFSIAGNRTVLPEGWESAGNKAWPCLRHLVERADAEGQLYAIAELCGLSRSTIRALDSVQWATLAEGLSWLRVAPTKVPIIQAFRHGGQHFQLPKAAFEDGTCIAFALADDYFAAYMDGDTDALRLLLATLARPVRNGKPAPIFDRGEVERNAARLRNIPTAYMAAAWMYWAGVKEILYDTYGQWLFRAAPDGPDDIDEEPRPDFSEDTPDFKWWGVFMDVAESGVFGDIRAVHQTNFHDLCVYLVRKEADRRRIKRETDAIKARHK